jgi:hypothetical protein
MSTKNGLGKLYDRLTPEERFRLDVLAMARGDEEESEHLTNTCPKRSYTMNEVGFTGRWRRALELTLLTLLDLRARMDKVQMIDAFRATFPYLRTVWENDTHEAYFDGHLSGSRHAWRKAGKDGEPPGWESDGEEEAERNADPAIENDLDNISERCEDAFAPILGALEKLEREFTQEALSQWAAYRGLCEEKLELEAMELLKAIMPEAVHYAQGIEERAERLEIEPDPESVEEYRAITDDAWFSFVGGSSWRGR